MRNIKNNFKKNSFIYEYLTFCESLETAEDFDFWGAIWILSLLCNRNILINRPNLYLYPNFYIILVANSGIARKSTAISFAKNILNEIIDNKSKIHLLTSTVSSQKFNQTLTKLSSKSNNCVIGINCSEFITFYKNKTLIYQLTDYYDCPNERKGYGTISKGNINIYNLFISSYTGSTPNYYIKAVNEDEICGGFTSRNIIIPAEKGKRRIAWNTENTTNEKIIRIGREIQKYIKQSKGICNLSTEAIRRYTNWYNRRRLNTDPFLQSFESREQDYVLKLACLFAINDMSLDISENHINLAIKFINHYKNNSYKYFKDEVYKEDRDELDILIEKIRKYIYSSGPSGIYHQQLYNHVKAKCDLETFKYIISIMHEFEMIEMLQPYKSKALIYRATKMLNRIKVKDIINNLRN